MPAPLASLLAELPPWVMIPVFGVGMALLLLGGKWLVDGAVSLARGLGLSTLFIGLTVVAMGTSAPELFLNLTAAHDGHPELSFGNVVGSNLANIGFVLALSAVLARGLPVPRPVVRWELPLLVFVSAAMCVMLITPWPAGGLGRLDGLLLLGGFLVLVVTWIRNQPQEDPLPASDDDAEPKTVAGPSRMLAFVLVLLGLAGLLVGADVATTGAVSLARWWGIPEAVIGLTIVAIATSLPEAAASLVAVKAGHGALAIGNIVGSNLFNILLVFGATSAMIPVPLPGAESWLGLSQGHWDLIVMMIFTVALIPIATLGRRRVGVGVGLVMFVIYVAYLAACTF